MLTVKELKEVLSKFNDNDRICRFNEESGATEDLTIDDITNSFSTKEDIEKWNDRVQEKKNRPRKQGELHLPGGLQPDDLLNDMVQNNRTRIIYI